MPFSRTGRSRRFPQRHVPIFVRCQTNSLVGPKFCPDASDGGMRDFGGLENGLPYSTARITLDSAGQYYESSVAPLYEVRHIRARRVPAPPASFWGFPHDDGVAVQGLFPVEQIEDEMGADGTLSSMYEFVEVSPDENDMRKVRVTLLVHRRSINDRGSEQRWCTPGRACPFSHLRWRPRASRSFPVAPRPPRARPEVPIDIVWIAVLVSLFGGEHHSRSVQKQKKKTRK